MNLRHLSITLLAINICLVAAVFVLYSRLQRPLSPSSSGNSTVYIENTVTQIAVRKFNATNLLSELATRRFGWKSIESTNYALYILNLRSVGCPEETVRDIIIADVAKLYAQQRESLRAEYAAVPYWQTLRPGETLATADSELTMALRDLEQEQTQLIQDLLSVNYHSELTKFASEPEAFHPGLGFLSGDKQEEVLSLLAPGYGNGSGDGVGGARVSYAGGAGNFGRLLSQQPEALAEILTPDELRLFELYTSDLAEQLRHELYGFDPSQMEFDQIYRLRKTYEEVLDATLDSQPDLASDLRNTALIQAETSLQLELSRILGRDRFASYRRSTDPDWHLLISQMDVSEDVASEVYNMKQQAAIQKQRIAINPAMTLQQRQAALLAIQRETQNTVANVLGSGLYQEYRKLGGEWLAGLEPTVSEPGEAESPAVPQAPAPSPVLQPDGTKTIIREVIVPEPIPIPNPRPGPVPQ